MASLFVTSSVKPPHPAGHLPSARPLLVVVSPGPNAAEPAHRSLAADLAGALRDGQLRLHRQPIVDGTTGMVVGAEALVRWRHPQRGLLPPRSFVELADQCGLASALDTWVLHRACADAASWSGTMAGLPVSVNLSASHLADGATVGLVAGICARTGLDPRRLVLEVTETALVPSATRGAAVLGALRELGVRVSLDDFGTGHSTLARLRALPVDEIKIDRSFVAGLPRASTDVAIVRSMITLAHDLAIGVVAEGVETAEQRDALLALGCVRMQGFLFGHPAPVRVTAVPAPRTGA